MRRVGVASLLAAGLLLGVSACGDDTGDGGADSTGSASESPSASASTASATPDCAEVWTAGQTLPTSYKGCMSEGQMVAADRFECSSGQVLVTYGDRYYAVLGGPVNDVGKPLEASRQYRSAWRSCSA